MQRRRRGCGISPRIDSQALLVDAPSHRHGDRWWIGATQGLTKCGPGWHRFACGGSESPSCGEPAPSSRSEPLRNPAGLSVDDDKTFGRGHRRRQSPHRDAALDAAVLLGCLAAVVEDLPGEIAAALPAGSLGPDNERVAARANGDGGVLARFAGDRLAQSLGGELVSES